MPNYRSTLDGSAGQVESRLSSQLACPIAFLRTIPPASPRKASVPPQYLCPWRWRRDWSLSKSRWPSRYWDLAMACLFKPTDTIWDLLASQRLGFGRTWAVGRQRIHHQGFQKTSRGATSRQRPEERASRLQLCRIGKVHLTPGRGRPRGVSAPPANERRVAGREDVGH